ncbi:Uncharacterised protein [Klebsiella oxytoca]|nr:Uncharacterised protein [Klebsiella oxytoca]
MDYGRVNAVTCGHYYLEAFGEIIFILVGYSAILGDPVPIWIVLDWSINHTSELGCMRKIFKEFTYYT